MKEHEKQEDELSSPYTLPIVLIGSFAKYAIAVVIIMATSEPGILSVIFGHISMIAMAESPMSEAVIFTDLIFLAYTMTLSRNSVGQI